MKIRHRFEIPCDPSETQRICGVGDIHLGGRGCHTRLLQETIEKIKIDPNAYWIGMGDYANFQNFKHPYFTAGDIDPTLTVADMGDFAATMQREIYKYLSPIKDQCIGLLYGNHELDYMTRNYDEGWHRRFCDSLGVPDLGFTCLFEVVFQDINSKKKKGKKTVYTKQYLYRVFATHGSGSAVSPTGKINRLLKYMNEVCTTADIYLMGHVHTLDHCPDVKLDISPDGKHLIERRRLGVITGSYLKTYHLEGLASYGERRGYAPTALGSAAITIVPSTVRLGFEWI